MAEQQKPLEEGWGRLNATPEQAHAMAEAIWQLLDDMQFKEIGGCVCGGAILQAREAIEPFADYLELEPHERLHTPHKEHE
ncbi:hypothetical protein HBA54_04240 [Pelagibius litoralis]|uniref:Uncharacterized protein n=1 Tax=Pelagibius litoralis TaxID=374515 RepID=A0A967C7I3_9PROT|nr:hypothetical protein [Pelagibius litoralis]NIA67792.1 hypothetical protein [Pelagibius litoralis]